jgi:hypothetical protein
MTAEQVSNAKPPFGAAFLLGSTVLARSARPELWEHTYDRLPSCTLFRRPHTFNLEDVNRIYSVANNCCWRLRRMHGL